MKLNLFVFCILLLFTIVNCDKLFAQSNITYKVFIPNVFSPNGDGVNDSIVINDTNLLTFELSIYNRYGRIIDLLTPQRNYWLGLNTVAKQPIENGSYFYQFTGILKYGNSKINQTGFIYLTR